MGSDAPAHGSEEGDSREGREGDGEPCLLLPDSVSFLARRVSLSDSGSQTDTVTPSLSWRRLEEEKMGIELLKIRCAPSV